MTAVTLTKWGNSCGVRIPVELFKKAGAYFGERFDLSVTKSGEFLLKPITDPQEGWLEAFNVAAKKDQDESLMENRGRVIQNDFDKDEWTW